MHGSNFTYQTSTRSQTSLFSIGEEIPSEEFLQTLPPVHIFKEEKKKKKSKSESGIKEFLGIEWHQLIIYSVFLIMVIICIIVFLYRHLKRNRIEKTKDKMILLR